MKKIISLVFVFTLIFTACTGDQGIAGPPGPPGNTGAQGPEGGIIASSAFEIDITFNLANQFSYTEDYGFEVLESDVALVYILWNNPDGSDVWRLLPQSVPFSDGTNLIYNFDFTQEDVRFFLDGTTNFTTLPTKWTQNKTFRVVVIPADNIDGLDVSNLNEVMQLTNISNFEMK
ncbi:MAG: hypothetical protein ABI263_06405 [Gelidibacter sp.]